MFDFLSLLVYSVVIVAFFALIAMVVALSIKNKMLKKDVAQGLIDQFALMQKLEEALKNTDEKH